MSQPETGSPETPNEETQATAPAVPAKRESRGSPALTLVFALPALGISIGLAVAGYFIWNQLQQLTGEQADMEPRLEQQILPLQNSLQTISNDWQAGRREIEQQLGRLGDGQTALGERVNRLAALVGRSESGWTLAEVEYLLRVASESLQIRRDKHTATAALTGADNRLRELADPQWLPVREQLARELNALREVPDVDFDGIALRISDDVNRVAGLPVAGSRYEPPQAEPEDFDATRTAGNWKDLVQVVWSSLKELFQLREHDKPVSPMLPPERAWFLKENLRLQLAAARLALLREDHEAYRQSLMLAGSWLKEWFDNEDQAVSAMVAGLEDMAAVDIHPQLPDISRSLQLLRQLQKQQEILAEPEALPGSSGESAPVSGDSDGDDQAAPAAQKETVPVQENAP